MDITKYIIDAELISPYKENELKNTLNTICSLYNLDLLSYEPYVEDWAIIGDKKGTIVLIHTKIKLIFTNMEIPFQLPIQFKIIQFKKYNDKIWSIDLNVLRMSNSKFDWHTQQIDTSCFSTQDLYYATV